MNKSSTAPCESHPCGCDSCAWEPPAKAAGSASDPKRRLTVVRSAEQYGCVRRDASIVVDQTERKPFMQIGDRLLPLSHAFGGILAGTQLETDLQAALT